MTKEPLVNRLYFMTCYAELAKFISYGGRRADQVKEKCEELWTRFAPEKVTAALHELTTADEKGGLTVLRPEVRPLCRQLLGPPPEDPGYASYYEANRRTPPEEHQPPPPEEEAKPAPKKGRKR